MGLIQQGKVLAVTETYYQFNVATSCKELQPSVVVHWDNRRDYHANVGDNSEKTSITHVCSDRSAYRKEALAQLKSSQTVIIGDFRSGVQLLVIFWAILLRKQVVLSEDGIIANIADLYDYSPKYINDGGVRSYKLFFLTLLRPFFRSCDRITVHPKFLESVGKSRRVLSASLGESVNLPKVFKSDNDKRLLFVGQVYSLMGLNSRDILKHLKQLADSLEGEYDQFLYSGHPKDSSLSHEEVLAAGWTLVGSLDSLKLNLSSIRYDLVGITSTSLVADYECVEKVMLLDARHMENKSSQSLFDIIKTQQVIQKIAQSENKVVSYLA